MRLKKQSSPKLLLESELETLRKERSSLGEEVTALTMKADLLGRAVSDAQEHHLTTLKSLGEAHGVKVSEMKSEIQSLEARKREALRPIDERKALLDERERGISSRESELGIREENLRAFVSRLSDKSAEIADKEAEIGASERKSLHREQMIAEAERINGISTSELS